MSQKTGFFNLNINAQKKGTLFFGMCLCTNFTRFPHPAQGIFYLKKPAIFATRPRPTRMTDNKKIAPNGAIFYIIPGMPPGI